MEQAVMTHSAQPPRMRKSSMGVLGPLSLVLRQVSAVMGPTLDWTVCCRLGRDA